MVTFRTVVGAATLLLAAACQTEVFTPAPPKVGETPALQTGRGFILRGGKPFEVRFDIIGGRAVFEGDIDLGPVERIAKTREELLKRPETGIVIATGSQAHRWYAGVIHYAIQAGFPDPQRLHDAMAQIHAYAPGVIFGPHQPSDNDYVVFKVMTSTDSCGQSAVGRDGGSQDILIAAGCGVGSVVHEILHAIGFWHEQSRCDRDDYVQILWDNIKSGQGDNFSKHCGDGQDVGTYDERSIMHYSAYAYTKNGLPTIHSLRGLADSMGYHATLSAGDIGVLNWLHPPPPPLPPQPNITYPGGVPTISWNAGSAPYDFSVRYVVIYNYWNHYDNGGWHDVHEEYSEDLGTTSNPFLTDTQRTFTGSQTCYLWNTGYDELYYSHWYEVSAYGFVFTLLAAVGAC